MKTSERLGGKTERRTMRDHESLQRFPAISSIDGCHSQSVNESIGDCFQSWYIYHKSWLEIHHYFPFISGPYFYSYLTV